MKSEMSIAMPVAADASVEGYELLTQPAGTYLEVDYFGPYGENMKAAHEAVGAYMEEHSMELVGAVMEEYITPPMPDADPSKTHTKNSLARCG